MKIIFLSVALMRRQDLSSVGLIGLVPRPDAVIITDDLVAFGAIQVWKV